MTIKRSKEVNSRISSQSGVYNVVAYFVDGKLTSTTIFRDGRQLLNFQANQTNHLRKLSNAIVEVLDAVEAG